MKRIAVCNTLLAVLLWSAAGSAEVVPAVTGPVHHVVIVWLKDHGSETARRQYIEATKPLSKLPMVQSYRVGTVVSGDKEVVDNTYDVAIVATFANTQARDEYDRHPEHDRVIEEALKPLVDKVVVYEFTEAP